MTDSDPEFTPQMQAFIAEQGLERAARLCPDVVAAAATKALVPIVTAVPPLTAPFVAVHLAAEDQVP